MLIAAAAFAVLLLVLADWREGATTLAIAAAGVSSLIGLVILLALRQREQGVRPVDEIQNSGERLRGIIQSAMDAVITVDEHQNILLFNAAAERIFGFKATEVIAGPLDRLIPERFRGVHRKHIEAFGNTGTSTRMMGPRRQLWGLRSDGSEFPIDASISQLTTAGAKLYTVILRDVTDRVDAERALQETRDRLKGIIDSAMDAVITIDEQQRVVLFNAAAERVFKCPSDQAIGGLLERFIPERFREAHRDHVRHFGATGESTRLMGTRLTLFGLRANGEEFPIDASISQVSVRGSKLLTVILRDITERKAVEDKLNRSYEELRAMSALMHEAREAERTRIARELHDELAQWLTAIKMDISWLLTRLSQDQASLIARTEKMKDLVDTTVASVRRIAADLRPVSLDDFGISAAVEHVVHEFAERTGIAVKLNLELAGIAIEDPIATAVYRMIQEALTNVARHARASEVAVLLAMEDDMLQVRVTDNGIGLPDTASTAKSFGILGIKERAQTLGGTARIYRPPEGGTVVDIAIPIDRYLNSEVA